MIRFIKVVGDSLTPVLEEGDFVLTLKIPFRLLHEGDVIVFRHIYLGTMIKLVDKVFYKEAVVRVKGVHPQSTDSRSLGPVPKKDIIGKMIWYTRKKP